VTNHDLVWWMRISIGAVLLAAAGFWFDGDPVNSFRITILLFIILPWVVALCLPASKFQHAFGMMAGSSMLLLPILVMLGILAPLANRSPSKDWFLMFMMSVALVIGLSIAISESKRGQVFATTAIVAMFSLLYEGAVLKIAITVDYHEPPPIEPHPLESVYAIQRCLLRYEKAHHAYPDSFAVLKNGDCMDKRLLEGIDVSYRKSQEPASDFELEVRLHSFWASRWPSFSAGRNGVVQSVNRSGEIPSPVTNPAQLIARIAGGLNRFNNHHGALPTQLSEVWKENPNAFPEMPQAAVHASFPANGYWFGYLPLTGERSFEITARPDLYGVTGLRSYYLNASGKMHVTMENRGATDTDELAPECEYQPFARCE